MPAGRPLTDITMWLFWLGLCPLAAAQTPESGDSVPLLERIASIVRENIDRLPNYTCTMTVDRSERVLKTGKAQMADRVRLEVAMVGDQELYAWPGSRSFTNRPIQDIAPAGTFSTGEFGVFLSAIFLSGTAQFVYDGIEDLNGRKVHHFTYRIPRERSKYTVIVPQGKAVVGYEGSVWCDAQSLDLARLEIVMREIPQNLGVSGGRLTIDYARSQVGRGDFLLPQSVDSSFTFEGLDGHNHTSFSGCREYAVESGISFGEVPATDAPALAKPSAAAIPAGVMIESKLETELDMARLAIGDPFEATVTKPARQKNVVVTPKGARIHGHVSAVLTSGKANTCVGVMLHPDWIEFEGREGPFDADQVVPPEPAHGPASPYARCPWQPEAGSALMFMEGGRFASSSGHSIVWRTVKALGEK
jgi:hypothetical protein